MALDRDFRAELGAHREAQHEASMSSLRAELEAARIRMDEQEGEMGKMSQWMASEIAKHKARLDLEIEALADTASQLGSSEAVALAHAMGSDERLNLQQRGVGAAQSPSRRTSPLGAVTVTGRGVDADAPWNTREGSAAVTSPARGGFLAAVVPSLAGDVTTAAKDPPRAGDVTAADDDGGGVRRRSFATREEAVSYRRRGKPSTYSYSDTKQEGGEAAEEVAHESHGGGGGSSSSSNSGIGSASAAQDAQDEVSRLRTQLAVMEDQMRARLANAAEAAMQECDTRRRDAEAAERWSRQLEEKLDRTSAALDIEREESRRLEAEIAHLHERLSAAEQVMVVAGTPASARHVSPQSGVTPAGFEGELPRRIARARRDGHSCARSLRTLRGKQQQEDEEWFSPPPSFSEIGRGGGRALGRGRQGELRSSKAGGPCTATCSRAAAAALLHTMHQPIKSARGSAKSPKPSNSPKVSFAHRTTPPISMPSSPQKNSRSVV